MGRLRTRAARRAIEGGNGWPPGWIEDLGDIRTARGVEAAMLLVPALVRRRGLAPFALTVAR